MITINKTKEIEIAGEVCLNIEYIENIEKFPLQLEEGHGIHLISNDEVSYTITSVAMIIGESAIEILGQLTYPMIEKIKDLIEL